MTKNMQNSVSMVHLNPLDSGSKPLDDTSTHSIRLNRFYHFSVSHPNFSKALASLEASKETKLQSDVNTIVSTSPEKVSLGVQVTKAIINILQAVSPSAFVYSISRILWYLIKKWRMPTGPNKSKAKWLSWLRGITRFVDKRSWLRNLWKLIELWMLIEGFFYVYCVAMTRKFQALREPPKLVHLERRKLFNRMYQAIAHQENPQDFLRLWYQGASVQEIKRENIVKLLKWGIFSADYHDALSHKETSELNQYVDLIQKACGYRAPEGLNRKIHCMRPSLDTFQPMYRPLGFYVGMHLGLEAIIEPMVLRQYGFSRRKIAKIRYWFKPSSSKALKNEKPLVFVHGIGIGLISYYFLIRDITIRFQGPIFMIEIPHISNRISPSIPGREEILDSIEEMLYSNKYYRATFAGHSFGSVYVGWVAKHRSHLVHSLVFIDPVVFMFNTGDVAHTFLYQKPATNSAKSQWINYFIRRDLFLSHGLFRHFWWYENTVWPEELQHSTAIILAELDDIVPVRDISVYLKSLRDLVYIHTFEGMGHGDFLWSAPAREVVVQLILAKLSSEPHNHSGETRTG